MKKVLLFPVLMLFSCGLAALYGAVHNQISYTVGPVYFHELKFIQFRIDPEFHNRIGAAWVGFQASWWMGLVIGLPIYIPALFIRGTAPFVRGFMRVSLLVVIITLLVGMAALIYAELSFSQTRYPDGPWVQRVSDPLAFAKAGHMHNYSYLGGMIGLLVGVFLAIWFARQSRKQN